VGILFVSAHFAFDERDRLLPQGIAHIDLFALETCREECESTFCHTLATASGACVRQQTSHELLDEMEGTKAYFRQFEHLDGAQWLPHGF
jgi:hypothetical protein